MSTTCTQSHSTENNAALTATIAELQNLLTWPNGWNSYDALALNPVSVSISQIWITEFYHHIISLNQQWIIPNVTASAYGEVVIVWRNGKHKLTIYINEHSIDYIQVWSNGVKEERDDGYINSIDDAQQLWQWLLQTSQQEQESTKMKQEHIATIEGGSYGLRDFPNGRPGVWFGVKWGESFGALIAFTGDEAEAFMIKNNINDIRRIDGKKCTIVDKCGIVHFIGMFHDEENTK